MSIKLQLPKVSDMRPRITVIGVGGAGGNAVNNMIAAGLNGVDFVVANTDAQALMASSAEHRIQLGANLTEGLGAGSRPEIGEAAAEEALEEIRAHISGAHMVFVAAGMGGGTGTGAAAVIARIAKDAGVLAVGIVTKPFQFEGSRRQRIAEAGIIELKKVVDTLIVIPNQNLFRIANEKTTFAEAFVLADQVLYSGISCIVDLIVKEGLINLDFADVRTILSGMGTAMMGTGEASGERRAILAAEEAIANPLLDEVSLKGAKGLLLSIIGGRNLTLYEVDEAASRVRQEVDADANIIVGATFDDSLGERVRVSIVASGMGRGEAATAPQHQSAQPSAPQMHAPSPAHGRAVADPRQAAHLRAAPAQLPSSVAQPAPPLRQTSAAPSATRHQSRADAEADELRNRLSAAMAAGEVFGHGEQDDAAYAAGGDSASTIAGAPWRAPGDVYIEEGPPQLTSVTHQQGAPRSAQAYAATQSSANFTPAAPQDVRRPQQRRMPELEDFPAVGQRDYRAKATAGSQTQPGSRATQAQAPQGQRKPGLLERLTGRGKRQTESVEPQRHTQDQRREPDSAPQRPAPPPVQRPAAHARVPTAAPESLPARRVANGGQGVELPVFFNRDGK